MVSVVVTIARMWFDPGRGAFEIKRLDARAHAHADSRRAWASLNFGEFNYRSLNAAAAAPRRFLSGFDEAETALFVRRASVKVYRGKDVAVSGTLNEETLLGQ